MLQQAELTDRGRRRKVNEDAYGSAVDARGANLLCVADGMGGHEAGDVASAVAVNAALTSWKQDDLNQSVTFRLANCVRVANDAVLAEAFSRGALGNMGCTIVLLAVQGQNAYLAHAGDSRIYRLRGGQLVQLTQDHTEAEERVASGEFDATDPEVKKYDHIVTRGVGLDDPVVPDFAGPLSLANDDIFMLCSDGLTGVVEDDVIRDVLRFHDIEDAARVLIRLANSWGGPDNITVQLARVGVGQGAPEAAPADYKVSYGPPIALFRAIAIGMILTGIAIGLGVCLS